MKKHIQSASLMGVLCLSLLSNGFAKEHYNRGNYYHKGQTSTARETTPPSGVKDVDGFDVFVTADFIYYNAVQNGAPFAYSGTINESLLNFTSPDDSNFTVPQGQVRTATSDWTPGFKVGLGMQTNHDNWSVYAEYTYLRARNTTVLSQAPLFDQTQPNGVAIGLVNPLITNGYGSNSIGIDPTDNNTVIFGSIESMTGTWRLSHNKINLDLARYFYVSPKLTMKRFVGMAAAWQTQELTANTPMLTELEAPSSNPSLVAMGTANVRDTSRMQAYALGLRTGLELGWHFTKSFSLQANMSGDVLWTNYHTQTLTSQGSLTEEGVAAHYQIVNISNPSTYKVNYVAEVGLALRYDWLSESQDYGFLIQAGWDAQTWINWGQFVSNPYTSGDFSMQGLDVRVRFDF